MAKTIIIHADDNAGIRKSTAFELGDEYDVRSFDDGIAALAAVLELKNQMESGQKVVVLTDNRMNVMHGPEFLKALSDAGLNLPTIILSGNPEREVRARLKELRADVDVYIDKASDGPLRDAIQAAIAMHEPPQARGPLDHGTRPPQGPSGGRA